ncbi:MAG: PadR family transcriptional regulator, partial [Actinomycetota bacterium]|nr:PadR family transcriptional regulator [Actinomycetota bacterium]
IYPMLARLDEDGSIIGRDASHGRRKRRAYELTPKGEKALVDWLSFEEPLAFEVRDVALLKLFFADAAEPEAAIEVVRRLRSRSERELESLRAQEASSAELAESGRGRFPAIALRAGLAVHESLISVAAELEAELGGA